MFDKEFAKELYKEYRGTPFYDALMSYNKKFDTTLPINVAEMVTIQELKEAIANNKEVNPYKHGLIY